MKNALQLMLAFDPSPLLLLGSYATYNMEAAMIACFRKVMKWSFTSIIQEFRLLTSAGMSRSEQLFDVEQFIDFFDISLVCAPAQVFGINNLYAQIPSTNLLQCMSIDFVFDSAISLVTDNIDDD